MKECAATETIQFKCTERINISVSKYEQKAQDDAERQMQP